MRYFNIILKNFKTPKTFQEPTDNLFFCNPMDCSPSGSSVHGVS